MFDLFLDEARQKGLGPIKDLYQASGEIISTNSFKYIHDYHVSYVGLGETSFPVFSETPFAIISLLN